jgi:hypothetical protein
VTRAQLEHTIRAAGSIADDNDVVVIGSQAILGEFPNAPVELLVSNEADVYPLARTERSDLIDATIGEGSPFQREFGYYAHGVDETTAVLPDGWRGQLVLDGREYPVCEGLVSGGSRFGHREIRGRAAERRGVHCGTRPL